MQAEEEEENEQDDTRKRKKGKKRKGRSEDKRGKKKKRKKKSESADVSLNCLSTLISVLTVFSNLGYTLVRIVMESRGHISWSKPLFTNTVVTF